MFLGLTLGHSHHPFGPPRLAPGNGFGSVGSVTHGGRLEEWSQGHVREVRLPSSDFKDVETEGKR